MTNAGSTRRQVTIDELVALLGEHSRSERCSLAFDGDGTLWSGDVSDDVFLAACRAEWLLPQLRPRFQALLPYGIEVGKTVGQLAASLFQAERQGKLEERLLFEAMTYAYAGRTASEVADFAKLALEQAGLRSRIRHEFRALLDWARTSGHDCWLVTASPWPIVRVAARELGFTDEYIVAARALESDGGIIAPAMAAPLPYREQKVVQVNERRKARRLLAAFGDSPFDFELLSAAEIAVAVSPKPALESRLQSLAHAYVLK
jgi:phosphatidylglycerophosphatase C